ncbi:hypothetical protein KCP69_03775 [Salmonella enterica subsp. enterica]|nr:hypothetical protein KCP69_03775 [Salmonella enterica subsp. enterica]
MITIQTAELPASQHFIRRDSWCPAWYETAHGGAYLQTYRTLPGHSQLRLSTSKQALFATLTARVTPILRRP